MTAELDQRVMELGMETTGLLDKLHGQVVHQ
jgi:hypothetical protein